LCYVGCRLGAAGLLVRRFFFIVPLYFYESPVQEIFPIRFEAPGVLCPFFFSPPVSGQTFDRIVGPVAIVCASGRPSRRRTISSLLFLLSAYTDLILVEFSRFFVTTLASAQVRLVWFSVSTGPGAVVCPRVIPGAGLWREQVFRMISFSLLHTQ